MAKILIIDDEEQLRKLLARIIGLEGYEVAEAADVIRMTAAIQGKVAPLSTTRGLA